MQCYVMRTIALHDAITRLINGLCSFLFLNRLFTTCMQLKKSFMNQIDAGHHAYGNTRPLRTRNNFIKKLAQRHPRSFHGFGLQSRAIICHVALHLDSLISLILCILHVCFACTIIKCNLHSVFQLSLLCRQ